LTSWITINFSRDILHHEVSKNVLLTQFVFVGIPTFHCRINVLITFGTTVANEQTAMKWLIDLLLRSLVTCFLLMRGLYDGVSKSFRTGRLERELQMVQLSATRCSIAIL
jgi:hypothetical protein